jgi:hypothetical protein
MDPRPTAQPIRLRRRYINDKYVGRRFVERMEQGAADSLLWVQENTSLVADLT